MKDTAAMEMKVINVSASLPSGCLYARGRFLFDSPDSGSGGVIRLACWQVGRVWINGTPLGPLYVRCHEKEWRYLEIDLSAYLRPGRNVIALLLHAWGSPKEVIAGVPDPRPMALAVAGRVGAVDLSRLDGWRFSGASDYLPAPRHNSLIGHEEYRDLRHEPHGWLEPCYDAGSWVPGVEETGRGGRFLPAPHRPLALEVHAPARIVEQGRLLEAWAVLATPPAGDFCWWRQPVRSAAQPRFFFHDQKADSRFRVNGAEEKVPFSPPMDWVTLYHSRYVEAGSGELQFSGWRSGSPGPMAFGGDRLPDLAGPIEWATSPEGPWRQGTLEPDLPHRLMIDRIESGTTTLLESDGRMAWRVEDEEAIMVLEFPRSITMLPRIEFADATSGVEVELVYSEHLSPAPGIRFPAVHRDRAILRGGAQVFEVALQYKSARCLAVIIRAKGGVAEVSRITAIYRHYDYDETGSFRCDNHQLEEVWRCCRNTMEAGSQDFIMDGPWREQLLYIGDNLVHNRVAYQLYQNLELVEWQHQLYADGQMADGLFQPNQPCRTPPNQYRLLDQTILWPLQLEDHWIYTGRREFIAEKLPGVVRLLDGFQSLFGRLHEGDPRLRNLTGWNWVDHPGLMNGREMRSIRHDGVPTAINVLYLLSLQSSIRLLKAFGAGEEAARFQETAAALRQVLRTSHWDEGRGVFSDGHVNGVPSSEVSLHVNLLAILAGLADDPSGLLDRTWKRDGVLQPCGFYFHVHLFEVLDRLGRHAELMAEMVATWGSLIEEGLTTTPEYCRLNGIWWDSVGHPWSTVPILYLVKSIAGLQPGAPGFKSLQLNPHLCGLRKLRVTVPVPQGTVTADLFQTDVGVAGSLWVPRGMRVEMAAALLSRIEVIEVNGLDQEVEP